MLCREQNANNNKLSHWIILWKVGPFFPLPANCSVMPASLASFKRMFHWVGRKALFRPSSAGSNWLKGSNWNKWGLDLYVFLLAFTWFAFLRCFVYYSVLIKWFFILSIAASAYLPLYVVLTVLGSGLKVSKKVKKREKKVNWMKE